MFLKNRLLRKSAAVLTSLAIFSSALPVIAMAEEAPTSGMCGDYTTWNFNADTKTLTLGVSGVSEDGAYTVSANEWYNYEAQIENIVIEEGVTSQDSFFNRNSVIKSVSIPSTLSNYAFENCPAIETVTFANGISEIPYGAFMGCSAIEEIVIPDSVTVIDINAFYMCSSLSKVTLSSNLTTIGNQAFYQCNSLTEIEIPDSVSSMDYATFSGTPDGFKIKGKYNSYAEKYALEQNITFEGTNELAATTGLKYNLLADGTYEATNYTGDELHVIIPSTFNGKPVTAISDRAFDNNTSIVEVVVPESVTKIGYRAFNGCYNLKSVKLHDGITEMGDGAFYNCSLSDGFTIPAGVKTLKSGLFSSTQLKEIVIPATVEVIESDAFWNCNMLEKVTISEGVRAIGDEAFGVCNKLTSFHIPSTTIIGWAEEYYVDANGTYWSEYGWLDGGVPSTNVGVGSSDGTISGDDVAIEEEVVEDDADVEVEVESDSIPSSRVERIPENGLPVGAYTRVMRGRINGNPIRGSGVTAITVAAGNPYVKAVDNVLYDKSGEILLAYPSGSTNKFFTVPEGVKFIEHCAFEDSCLEEIKLPESLVGIDSYAFTGCGSLKNITIPKNVKGLDEYVFSSAYSLENVYIDDANPYYYDIDGVVFEQRHELITLSTWSDGSKRVHIRGSKFNEENYQSENYVIGKDNITITYQAPLVENDSGNVNPGYSGGNNTTDTSKVSEVVLCENPVGLVYYPEGRTAETYTVPAGVQIVDCSFDNVKELIIPEGVYTLGYNVIDSWGIETITIPASVKNINSHSDSYPSTLTIKGYTNSCADIFAKTHNINFVSIGEVDPEGTYYYIRTTVEGGKCIVSPIDEAAVLEGGTLTLTFTPDNSSTSATQYEIESVTIDGVDMGYIKSYTFENVTADHNVVVKLKTISNRIPTVSRPSGSYGPVNTTPVTDEDEKNAILVKDTEGAIEVDGTDEVWEEIAEEMSEKKDGETVAIKLPAAATEIPANLLESVQGKDVEVEIKLENGVTWCINGLSVRDPKAINLGVTINANNIPRDALTNVPNGVHNIEVSLEHDGDLGFDATLTFDFDERYNNFYSNLYFYNPDLDDFEFMGAATIHNGKAGHGFSHASDYIIIVDEENLGKKVVEIEDEEDIASDDEEDRIDEENETDISEENEEEIFEEDDDENPATGTAVSLTALTIAAAAVVITRKKKADK